jgi:hypothetical protein
MGDGLSVAVGVFLCCGGAWFNLGEFSVMWTVMIFGAVVLAVFVSIVLWLLKQPDVHEKKGQDEDEASFPHARGDGPRSEI